MVTSQNMGEFHGDIMTSPQEGVQKWNPLKDDKNTSVNFEGQGDSNTP